MFDCIIVGSGIAGISVALTLKQNNKNFLLLGDGVGGKTQKAERVTNYPGLSSVTGKELTDALEKQLKDTGITVTEERANGVFVMKDKVIVATQSGKTYEGKTCVLAVGVESIKTVTGEKEFTGRGVSYCATCDGNLYKGKDIAVICSDKKYEHEAEFLFGLAKKTYYFPMYKDFEVKAENVEIIRKMPTEIVGNKRVEKIVVGGKEIFVDGVFVLKDAVPSDVLCGGLETENGFIKTDRSFATNLKGVFACGDCVGRPFQYAKASGEGNVVAFSVIQYLNGQKEKEE